MPKVKNDETENTDTTETENTEAAGTEFRESKFASKEAIEVLSERLTALESRPVVDTDALMNFMRERMNEFMETHPTFRAMREHFERWGNRPS